MTTWIKRWQAEVAPTRLPGVWKLRTGGHLVRARVTTPTGKLVEIRKRLPETVDEAEAFAWLRAEQTRIRTGDASDENPRQRFASFASSLMAEKVATREIASARGREKWKHTLTHLIAGTKDVEGFGEMPLERLTPAHVERWRVAIAKLIAEETYAPATVNTWIGVLKVITKAARKRLHLPFDAAEDLKFFDLAERPTYTEEQPNSLTAAETRAFLAAMKSEFPQHYAMTFLGFTTGLRPSHLRPLRRKGPTPEVKWEEAVLLVRRSHTLGETMERTKTKLRQRINLPPEVIDVLRWHERTQLVTDEQKESDLLFPAEDGRPRSESCLKKPFAVVATLLGFEKKITPKAMRRTFTDLTRLARVESVVSRSISGHKTESMREQYSTVSPDEQRAAMRGLLRLVRGGDAGGDRRRAGGDARRRAR